MGFFSFLQSEDFLMAKKPSYEKLERKVKELEKQAVERKRAEEALGEFREFKEKIISESPIGMME
jgi:hypothetical protein